MSLTIESTVDFGYFGKKELYKRRARVVIRDDFIGFEYGDELSFNEPVFTIQNGEIYRLIRKSGEVK